MAWREPTHIDHMNALLGKASLVTIALSLGLSSRLAADTVFAYNKATLSISAVPATSQLANKTRLEERALANIGARRTDILTGRVVLVWATSRNIVNDRSIQSGFVSLAAGQSPGSPISHAGNYWSDITGPRFLRSNNGGRSHQGALNILETEQGGRRLRANVATCWDTGVMTR